MLEVAHASARPRERAQVAPLAFLRRLDWILLAATLALSGYGLWVTAGITRYDVPGDEGYYVVRQGVALGVGLVALAVATVVPVGLARRFWKLLYATTLALMLLVLVAA
ncbi:MAG: hypothetical protein NZL88_07845, partial [Gaiellaceae bacterium]|nr:hypothetical protein [Gaiellaceae bacterium]